MFKQKQAKILPTVRIKTKKKHIDILYIYIQINDSIQPYKCITLTEMRIAAAVVGRVLIS